MKVTATRDVYTYDELPPDAQKRALELLCNEAWESLDSDMVTEDLNAYLVELGTGNGHGVLTRKELFDKYDVRIYWQVAYTQGDFAAVEGYLRRSDLPKLAWPNNVEAIRVVTTGRGNHSYPSHVIVGDDDEIYEGATFEAAANMIQGLNRKLYRFAQQQCEGYTSASYVLDAYRDIYELSRRFTDEGEFAPTPFWTDDNGEGGN
jgi:hypothetical protein